jgi:hypothetical protein
MSAIERFPTLSGVVKVNPIEGSARKSAAVASG